MRVQPLSLIVPVFLAAGALLAAPLGAYAQVPGQRAAPATLQGPPGAQGQPGPQGPAGVVGSPGVRGPRGKKGDAQTSKEKVWMLLAAGAIGGLVSLLVNIFTNVYLPTIRRRRLTKQIAIGTDPPHEGHARHRVINGGFWTINEAILYLQLDFVEADTLQPPQEIDVYIRPGSFVPLSQEQLCWSVSPNPMKVSVLAKEEQPFSPCKIRQDGILIPSERGWRSAARVFLRRQAYTGRLKIVSADTDARWFQVRIDPDNADNPCTITAE